MEFYTVEGRRVQSAKTRVFSIASVLGKFPQLVPSPEIFVNSRFREPAKAVNRAPYPSLIEAEFGCEFFDRLRPLDPIGDNATGRNAGPLLRPAPGTWHPEFGTQDAP